MRLALALLAALAASAAGCAPAALVAPDLAGSRWTLATLEGAGAPAVPSANAPFLAFTAERAERTFEPGTPPGTEAPEGTFQLSGSDGCNGFSGAYRVEGDALRIGIGPMTLRACPDLDPLPRRFTDAVTAAGATYAVEGDTLRLTAGATTLVFRRTP